MLQAFALIVAPLGGAHAAHAETLGSGLHSHFASNNTEGDHTQPHHGLATDMASYDGAIVADSDLANDEDNQDLGFCCHFSGGACGPTAIVVRSEALAFFEHESSFINAFENKFVDTFQSGIFHPPRQLA